MMRLKPQEAQEETCERDETQTNLFTPQILVIWFDGWDSLTPQSNLGTPPQACAIIPVGPFINLPALLHTPNGCNSITVLNSTSTYCCPLSFACVSVAAHTLTSLNLRSCWTHHLHVRSLKTRDQIQFLMPDPSLLSLAVALSRGLSVILSASVHTVQHSTV